MMTSLIGAGTVLKVAWQTAGCNGAV